MDEITRKKKQLVILAKKTGNMPILEFMYNDIVNHYNNKLIIKPGLTRNDVICGIYETIVEIVPNTPENITENFKKIMNNWKKYMKKRN